MDVNIEEKKDKKKTNQALVYNVQMAIFNEIEDIVYVADPNNYELLYVNEYFKDSWGHDVIGKKCHKVLQNLDEPCPFCTNSIIFDLKVGEPHIWEFQNTITKRWYKCTDKVIKWSDDKLVRFEHATDITLLKSAQEQLKKSEEKYRLLFQSMNEGFAFHQVVYDKKGKPIDYIFKDINPRFEQFAGIPKEELLNKKVSTCTNKLGSTFPIDIENFGQLGRQGGDLNQEFYFKEKDIWFSVSAFSPLQDHFCTLFEDITAKKKAEEAIQQAMAELKTSNQELEQFAYVASHDLQEPLRMVAGFTHLIKKNYQNKIDEKANTYINYATEGATRMQSLINDLLDFSRITTKGDKFKETDCNIVLGTALSNLKYKSLETGAIITNDVLPTLKIDGGQISRVFQNLISNAIKFKGKSSPHINITCSQQDGEYMFCVQDNGIGINLKYKDKIFVIFQRLNHRKEYEGTGIGLSICKRIIERHKGRIWVESEPNHGSKFFFTLPHKK